MAVQYNTIPAENQPLVAEAPKKKNNGGRVVAAVVAAALILPAPGARRVKPIAPLYASLPSPARL